MDSTTDASSHQVDNDGKPSTFALDTVAAEAIGGHYGDMPDGYFHSAKFIGTVIVTCLAQMSGYLSYNVPANVLDLINADLGPSPDIVWVSVVWTFGLAVGLTLVGRLSDIFGRRWFFTGATFITLVGNIVGATAQSISQLIAANLIIGLSAAGQLSFNVVLGELVPNRARGPFNALVLFTSMPFSVFAGPVARATFLTPQKWRWCYYVGIIINAIATLLWFFFYHPPTYGMLHVHDKSKRRMMQRLDWIGIVLFCAGLALFLIGLNWGGTDYAWDSAHVLATLLTGIATLVGFGVWQAFGNLKYPLIPTKLFLNAKYDALVACAAVGAMIYYSLIVLWPVLVGALFTINSTEIGWLSCAVGGGLVLGQTLGGIGWRYIGHMRIQMVVSSIVMVSFVASLAAVDASSRHRSTACVFLGALGSGYIESLSLSSIALVWEAADIGLVSGVMGCIRTAFGAIATSLYNSVLASELNKYQPRYVTPAALDAGLPETSIMALFEGIAIGDLQAVPGITPRILEAVDVQVKRAYSRSFKTVFLITLVFGAIVLVAALFCPDMEEYKTDVVARKLHERRSPLQADHVHVGSKAGEAIKG